MSIPAREKNLRKEVRIVVEKERLLSTSPEFLFLRAMKGLKEALVEEVTEEFNTFDLKRFEKASSEDQGRIIKSAFDKARQEYSRLAYQDKLKQLGQAEEAFEKGDLNVSRLLQELELR
ncbi:MAG: hypothetical protein ACPLY7_00370, partial [Microgenomates group bacterium]